MLYEVLPDPRALIAAKGTGERHVLHIHRTIPERVPVGHFESGGVQVIDDVVDRTTYLQWIQQVCVELGDGFEARFYDHVDDGFDASVLDHLDGIRCLAIDGLERVHNPDAIGRLPRLSSLRFGPRRIDDARILETIGVHRLVQFTLASSPTPSIDLAPVAEARALRSLRLLGHGKNTQAIGRLTQLTELAIQPSAKFDTGFISQLVSLETLKFVLGNAKSMSSIETLPRLQDLSLREVRHLEELGSLERFPRLRRLLVSDQPRIAGLRVGRANVALEHLYLYSVPGLRTLTGLSALPALKSLFTYDSGLTVTWSDLPATVTHFQMMTRTIKGREAHAAEVRGRGLIPEVHPDSQFFYK